MPPPADSARRLAADVLAPTAEATDQAGEVPPGHIALLAEEGLLGLAGPTSAGGAGAALGVQRAVHRVLGGACGATGLLWAGHQAAVELVAASPSTALRDAWLSRLCRGEVLAGAASDHLRATGPAALEARPDGEGWRLDGRIPRVLGWGRVGPTAVAAHTVDGDVLWVLVDLAAAAGASASTPLAVAAMQGATPVRVHLDGLLVPAEDVVLQVPPDLWWSVDDLAATRPDPAVAGITERAIRLLADSDPSAADGLALDLAEHDELAAVQQAAADDGAADLASLAATAAAAVSLAQRATGALLAASGPAGLDRSHPAQRLAREVLHHASRLAPVGTRADGAALVAAGPRPQSAFR